MSNSNFSRTHGRRVNSFVFAVAFVAMLILAQSTEAATWKGIEPFNSRRVDVERVLGAPVEDRMAENGTLHFNVSGGMVTIFFVTPKFVAAKKLSQNLEGTVLQVILQHEHAADTPESLKLVKNSDYERQSRQEVDVYTNAKEGIIYTFLGGKLKTTRFSYSANQLARIQQGKG
ncbi:MAG TPA: hypothetical protein VM934_15440 [Pyrinomonadaceae bacterium]|jgi:hypothetical protein|nr:hypothetical protein [Pyrinomonadaceae bacterium]